LPPTSLSISFLSLMKMNVGVARMSNWVTSSWWNVLKWHLVSTFFFQSANNELLRILKICVPVVRLHPQTRIQDQNASKTVLHMREQQSYTGRTILHWILQQAVQMKNSNMVNPNRMKNWKVKCTYPCVYTVWVELY
jgi:hypothetical protein